MREHQLRPRPLFLTGPMFDSLRRWVRAASRGSMLPLWHGVTVTGFVEEGEDFASLASTSRLYSSASVDEQDRVLELRPVLEANTMSATC
jgi:hypothetical protein